MPLTEAQIITRVRNKTTDNTVWLPDLKILEFADAIEGDNTVGGLLDLNGVLADAWEYMARDDIYMSQTIGAVSVSQPVAQRKAEFYRRASQKGGGVIVVIGTMSRADLLSSTSPTANEWGDWDVWAWE